MVSRDRHGSQRVLEVRAATAADLVAVAFDGENAAQLRVVAPEREFQRTCKRTRNGVPQRNLFGRHVFIAPPTLLRLQL